MNSLTTYEAADRAWCGLSGVELRALLTYSEPVHESVHWAAYAQLVIWSLARKDGEIFTITELGERVRDFGNSTLTVPLSVAC